MKGTLELGVECIEAVHSSRTTPGRERDLRTVLLIGATADPFEGDSVEIERALTDLGVRNGGARPPGLPAG